ncbi:MogA/MoaB family molybdenum cofactor biosynthesis protein [Roseburia hominis]
MKAAILPVDTLIYRKLKEDTCTPIVKRMLSQVSFKVELVQPVPNDKEVLRKVLARIADSGAADLVITIGGIGCREEDWTPEATKAVVDKEIPGMGEAMRLYMIRTRKRAMLTRGTAGIRGNTLIVNLPGSPKVMKECLEYIMPEIVYTTEVVLGEHDDIKE